MLQYVKGDGTSSERLALYLATSLSTVRVRVLSVVCVMTHTTLDLLCRVSVEEPLSTLLLRVLQVLSLEVGNLMCPRRWQDQGGGTANDALTISSHTVVLSSSFTARAEVKLAVVIVAERVRVAAAAVLFARSEGRAMLCHRVCALVRAV